MEPTTRMPWVLITPDRLTAHLWVPQQAQVDVAVARDLLAGCGVRHGVMGDVLRACAHPVDQERRLVLATGETPPDLAKLTISPVVNVGQRVSLGEVIATTSHTGAVNGVGVDGQLVPPGVIAGVGVGLELREDGTVTARRDGVVRKESDGTFKVVIDGVTEVELNSVLVQIDAKTTEAWFDLLPRHYLSAGLLHRILGEQRIVRGIHSEIFAEVSLPSAQPRRIKVAIGIPPTSGFDGRLEMRMDEAVHLKVDPHGRVDWHDHGKTEDVAEATPLAQILPPTAGVHGVDVRGNYLESKPGRPLDPARVMGEGVRLNAIKPDLIEAASAGHFHRDRQRRLCVQPRLVVDGDVDHRHGNIDTRLSVLVKGDVKTGFSIKSGGDIEVMGVIEDARISAHGNLLVRGGILQGTNRVKAIGDIDARHVSNRELKCHTLRVGSSLRWSRVMATGEVIAKEILGGDLIVAGNITVDQIGSADGLMTRVQVGTNPFEERQFLTAREQHEQLVEAVRRQKQRCKLIAHRVTADPAAGEELRTALSDFSAACAALASCEALLERHSVRQGERACQQVSATINVSGTAYRGVEIHFDEVAKLMLDKNLTRPQFRLSDGSIVW
jgi:uncharacterized protein